MRLDLDHDLDIGSGNQGLQELDSSTLETRDRGLEVTRLKISKLK